MSRCHNHCAMGVVGGLHPHITPACTFTSLRCRGEHYFNFRMEQLACREVRSVKWLVGSWWLSHGQYLQPSISPLTIHHWCPPPATDPGRTDCTPLYPPVQAVPLYSLNLYFSYPGQRNWRRMARVPVTSVRYNTLLWICTLNTLTWRELTWPDLTWPDHWCSNRREIRTGLSWSIGWSRQGQEPTTTVLFNFVKNKM